MNKVYQQVYDSLKAGKLSCKKIISAFADAEGFAYYENFQHNLTVAVTGKEMPFPVDYSVFKKAFKQVADDITEEKTFMLLDSLIDSEENSAVWKNRMDLLESLT